MVACSIEPSVFLGEARMSKPLTQNTFKTTLWTLETSSQGINSVCRTIWHRLLCYKLDQYDDVYNMTIFED